MLDEILDPKPSFRSTMLPEEVFSGVIKFRLILGEISKFTPVIDE